MFEVVKAMAMPFLVVALFLITTELLFSRHQKLDLYQGRDSLCNFAILIISKLSQPLFLGYYFSTLKSIEGLRLYELPSSIWMTILAVVLTDLLYYFEHRMSHRLRYLWLFHEVHHSSKNFNLSTSFRLSWLGRLTAPIVFAPLILLGFRANQVIVFFAINLFYQFFLHTQAVGKLGILEGILNTPSAHRVHHARNELYIDKNFGGILMVWDRLFGTYQSETEKPVFGTLGGFESNNPFTVQFHNLPGYRMVTGLKTKFSAAKTVLLMQAGLSIALSIALPIKSAQAEGLPKPPLEGHAEITENGNDQELTGLWKGHVKEYARHPSILIEQQVDDKVSGTYKGLLGRFPLSGTFNKETGTIQLLVDFSASPWLKHTMFKSAVAVMNGTFSGDTITGTANIEEFGRKPVHFEAHRSKSKKSVKVGNPAAAVIEGNQAEL